MSSLARKYRPSSFPFLIGQDSIKDTLSIALDKNKLTDSYLFSGLRGSGKTSSARIFAKSMICEKGITSTPCEKCSNCIMMQESRHIDVIEMDGASNRKIDDIRTLIENIKYKPSIARFKIFIIDEVHMLTKEAFNALLKTLEEPPSFIKFILATTDPLKVPITIRSRTQHFYFKKISKFIMLEHLQNILIKEKVHFEIEALEIIIRNSGGSIRDSLTMLEQAIRYSNDNISLDSITKMLGVIDPFRIQELMQNIINKEKEKVLSFIQESLEFEEEMIIQEMISNIKISLISPNDKNSLPLSKIEFFFEILSDALQLLDINRDKNFVLTLSIFKMMDLDKISIKPIATNIKTEDKFTSLLKKIYFNSEELGEIFKNKIHFISFENNTLSWQSEVEDKEKDILRSSWNLIKNFVEEIYGIGTQIKNINKKIENTNQILEEPMVREMIKVFEPEKVKIIKK